MRLLCSLTILACLGIATSVLAQDPFQGIPVEPRPSEYIHWDAEAFAELQSQLEQELRDGSRIWGTRFVYTSTLPRADHRHHDVQIIHRSGYTQPEIHATKWDIYVILDGIRNGPYRWGEGELDRRPPPRRAEATTQGRPGISGHRRRHAARPRPRLAPGVDGGGRVDHVRSNQRDRVIGRWAHLCKLSVVGVPSQNDR